MSKLWISCDWFTVQANTKKGIIVWTAPIVRRFIGQPWRNLVRWAGPGVKVVLLLLLSSIVAALCSATTLTGSLNSPNATGTNGTLYLSLSQQAALVTTGGCGGPVEVLPTIQVRIQVVNGAMQGSPSVYGNDCLLPNGTWYNVGFIDTGGNVLMNDRWTISGATVNIGTIVSVVISGTTQIAGAPGVVLTQPTTTQTIVQPGGTNLGINILNATNTLTFPNGMVCTSGGCSGAMTFSGNILIGTLGLSTLLTLPGGQTCDSTGCNGVWNFGSAVNFNGGLTTHSGTTSAIYIGNGGYIFPPTVTGSDITCGSIFATNPYFAFRLDTAQLEVCINGVVKKAQLN